eukprot:2314395-Amphidinium_carterae.1
MLGLYVLKHKRAIMGQYGGRQRSGLSKSTPINLESNSRDLDGVECQLQEAIQYEVKCLNTALPHTLLQ